MFEKTPLFAESWNVAFRNRPSGTIFDDQKTPFTVIPNSFRYWWRIRLYLNMRE